MSANNAVIVAVMGASGSGKSLYIKQQIKKGRPSRLLIFDPMGEYGEYATPCTSLAEVAAAVQRKKFKVAYQPKSSRIVEQFNVLCKLAYAAGDCWLAVDELSIVTKPTSAPPGWSDCSMRGRHKGMVVIGGSQRPANIDKNFFGNATLIRTGRLNFEGDIKTLANVLRVPGNEISELPPLSFIERNMQTGAINRGHLTI